MFVVKAKALGASRNWREVLRLLDDLEEDGKSLGSHVYNSAMSALAKSGR